MSKQSEQEIKDSWSAELDKMSQIDLARLWRFAPPGCPVFNSNNPELYEKFKQKFKGMTPQLSKAIGWDR